MSQSRNRQRGHSRPYGQSRKSQSFSELGENVYKTYFKDKNVSILEYQEGDNMDIFIQQVEEFVEDKGENLSKTQLRNIYDKILSADDLISLKMIRPQLAYLAGRATGNKANDIKEFLSFINILIKETSEESIDNFKQFMQMVIAYHKFYGKN